MIKNHEECYIGKRTDKAFVSEAVGKVYLETDDGDVFARSQSFDKCHRNELSKLASEFVVEPVVSQTIFELYPSPDADEPGVVEKKYVLSW